MFRPRGRHQPTPIFRLRASRRLEQMTKTKSRILAALALTTALTAPALIVPAFTAPPAIAGEATPHDFSDLAAKVTPAVVNVQVTMKTGASDDEDIQMSDRGTQDQLEEFMRQFA